MFIKCFANLLVTILCIFLASYQVYIPLQNINIISIIYKWITNFEDLRGRNVTSSVLSHNTKNSNVYHLVYVIECKKKTQYSLESISFFDKYFYIRSIYSWICTNSHRCIYWVPIQNFSLTFKSSSFDPVTELLRYKSLYLTIWILFLFLGELSHIFKEIA